MEKGLILLGTKIMVSKMRRKGRRGKREERGERRIEKRKRKFFLVFLIRSLVP